MAFHVLRHVQADHGIFIAEEGFRQRPGELRLTHTGGAQEDEGADGPLGILQPRMGPAHGLGDHTDGLILAHHPLMEDFLQIEQAHGVFLGDIRYRYPCPVGHHLGDIFRGDHRLFAALVFAPLLPLRLQFRLELLLQILRLAACSNCSF